MFLAAGSLVSVAGGGVATAYWSSTASGNATAVADALPVGNKPTVKLTGAATVTVDFPRAVTTAGRDVTVYRINRYTAIIGTVPSATWTCSWPSGSRLACTGTAVLAGASYYTTTPMLGDAWIGQESPKSSAVQILGDLTAPAAPAITYPATGSYGAAGWTGWITGTAADTTGGSGIATTRLTIMPAVGARLQDGSASATTTATWLSASGTSSWTFAFARPADGTYTIAAHSTDLAGNIGPTTSRSIIVDTAAPSVTISAPGAPSTDRTPMLSGTYGIAPGDTSAVSVQVFSGPTPVGVAVAATLTGASAPRWTATMAALPPGSYIARASQTDAAGNIGTATTSRFTITSAAVNPVGTQWPPPASAPAAPTASTAPAPDAPAPDAPAPASPFPSPARSEAVVLPGALPPGR